MKHTIICDSDGTVCDPSRRLHHVRGPRGKDWPAFFGACGGTPRVARAARRSGPAGSER